MSNLVHLGLMSFGVLDETLDTVLRMGLTGGMGAGKSTVSKLLVELGAVLVDSDRIAREVVAPGTPGLDAVVAAFGADVLQADGSLDRAALAGKAFATPESTKQLNSIVHPLVGARTAELIDGAPPDAIVVQDIPLLVENRFGAMFNLVAVVYVDAGERVRRLVEYRDVTESDARARIAAQASDEDRRAAADVWLDNTGAPGDLDDDVRKLWTDRLVPFERNIRERYVVRHLPELVPARSDWQAQAERLIARLRLVCADKAVRIDHIGSTAVAGLDAKDVIDLQVTVRDLGMADALADPLAGAGFPRIDAITGDDPKPDGDGNVDPALWAKRIHGSADPGRTANIHIRVEGSPGQQFALLFRDWLRAQPAARAEYVAIKLQAAAAASVEADYAAAIAAYVDAKAPWFDTVYPRVLEWADR